jgi:Protein of unknown function (DUF3568)
MSRLPLVAASAGMIVLTDGCALTARVSTPTPEPPAATSPSEDRRASSPRYSTGRAMQDFEYPSGKVAAAVLEAMEDLNITVTRRDHDGPASQIEGRTPNNQPVTVTLRPQKPITHVSCRVGLSGDEPVSRTLLRRVAVRLGTLPPEAIPDKVPSAPASNPYFSRDAIPDAEMMRDFIEAPYRSRPDM